MPAAWLIVPSIDLPPCAAAPPGDRNWIRWSAVVRTHLGHLSDPSEIVGLAVRELLLAARPKFTGIYVGNGLRFAEIRLSRLKKHTHTHTSDTHARLPTSESGWPMACPWRRCPALATCAESGAVAAHKCQA